MGEERVSGAKAELEEVVVREAECTGGARAVLRWMEGDV